MRKILLALLGLLLLVILAYFCFENKSDDIREDLVSRTQSTLGANEFSWAKVDLKGDDLEMTNIIQLAGFAPTKDAKLEAERLALGVLGVGGVDNQLIVKPTQELPKKESQPKEAKDDSPSKMTKEVSKQETPEAQKSENIYKMYMVKNAQGKVLIDGYVRNKKEHDRLISYADKLFDKDNVIDKIIEKEDAPQDWIYITEFSLKKLSEVDYGDMNITNTSYVFNAHLPSNDKKLDFLNSIREVMSNPENHYGRYRGDYIVTAPVAGAVIPVEKHAENKIKSNTTVSKVPCQKALDKAINSRKIHFAYDKADIQSQSYTILDDIVVALKNCDLKTLGYLEIDGHTDSIGSAIYNKRLSQKRADSIKSYLVKKGFNASKLKAVGFGESKPIATNMNEAGRAKNRRTEFIVKGVK